jgi:hypothetical protein
MDGRLEFQQNFVGPQHIQHTPIERMYGLIQERLCKTKKSVGMYLYYAEAWKFGVHKKMFYTEEEAKAWVVVMVRL